MKVSIDGDAICITADNFVNLAESPAIFIQVDTDLGKELLRENTYLQRQFWKQKKEREELEKNPKTTEDGD